MRNLKAITLLCVVAVISAATVLYGMTNLMFYDIPVSEYEVLSSLTQTGEAETAKPETENQTSSQKAPALTSSATQSEPTTVVQENHTVSGAIISKHINPTSAPLGAGNVYLKNSSGASVDINTELSIGPAIHIDKGDEPQLLIVHTHATESYMLTERDYYTTDDASRSTDEGVNMVAIGEIIANKVRSAGFSVLHDKTLHDYPSYTGSYTASAKTIKQYLKDYPSIKIVIDVHRDAVSDGSDKVKLVTEIDGKNAAQVMLVMGSETGGVSGFPNWRENLRLAMRFHQTLETMYPSLARPLMLMSKKYNQNLTNGSMLIEMGTDANTLDEAKYSAELVGNALSSLLLSLS